MHTFDKEEDECLESFFKDGIETDDFTEIFLLKQNELLFEAFSAIFKGSSASVIAKIYVLKGLASDDVLASWNPSQIRSLFNIMDSEKLDMIIAKLRKSPILNYDSNDGLYRLSDIGRIAVSSLNSINTFAQEDDTGLGFMFAQIAANDAMGVEQSPEALQHLLFRLNSLYEDFEDSIVSGSERRIKESERKLNSMQKFVSKGSDVISKLTQAGTENVDAYRLAQKIGRAQSRLSNSTATIHRSLNKIERQRIDLGESGISVSEINNWLADLDIQSIASFIDGEVAHLIEPDFILSDLLMDTAEDELLKEHASSEKQGLPDPVDAVEGSVDYELEGSLEAITEWMPKLQAITGPVKMSDIIRSSTFGESSYLMSLLSIVGVGGQGLPDNIVGDLARLPLEVTPTTETEDVDHVEVSRMSVVRIAPKEVKK